MTQRTYVPVRRLSRKQVLENLSRSNPQEIRETLVSISYWEDDWSWVQRQLLTYSEHKSELVLWAVAVGLGYLAIFTGEIDVEVVRPVLRRLQSSSDPLISAAATDAEDDIEHFVVARQKGQKVSLGRRLPEDWRPPPGHFPE
jgi:hypothetical protein